VIDVLKRAATSILTTKRAYTWSGNTFIPTILGRETKAGVRVSEDSALKYAAVWACVNNKANDIASLTRTIILKQGPQRFIASEHDQYYLLKAEPHPRFTGYAFFKTLTIFHELWGAAFAEIQRNGTGRPIAYRFMHPQRVRPILIEFQGAEELFWKDDETGRTIHDRDVVRIAQFSYDGIYHKSAISVFKDTIGMGIAQNDAASELFANQLRTDGYIQYTNALSSQAADALRENWENKLQGWETPILDNNSNFHEFGMPLTDAQFIQNREFQVEDVARIYRMPPHKIGHLKNAIKSNIHEQNQEYRDDTLRPLVVCIEQEFNRKVFRPAEKGHYQFKMDLKSYLRGDPAKRAAMYEALHKIGAMTADEAREKEDMNPLPSEMLGDKTFTRVDTIPTDRINDYVDNIVNNQGA